MQVPFAELSQFFEEHEQYVAKAVDDFTNLDSSMEAKKYDAIVQRAVFALRFYQGVYYYYSRNGMRDKATEVFNQKILPLLRQRNWSLQKASFDGLRVYSDSSQCR